MREFDQGTIPGSDVEMNGYQQQIPLPQTPEFTSDEGFNDWLPKTDWSRDGIIANGQQ